MKFNHFIIIAATCIGAFVAYQWIQAGQAKEQCRKDAIVAAATSGTGMNGIRNGLIQCAVRHGEVSSPYGIDKG